MCRIIFRIEPKQNAFIVHSKTFIKRRLERTRGYLVVAPSGHFYHMFFYLVHTYYIGSLEKNV